MPFNWQQFHAGEHRERSIVDPRRRLRILLTAFAAALLLILARAVHLEVSKGAGFRAEALRPIDRESMLRAPRGRILARNGDVLAYDRSMQCVAVAYRWLQQPPDERWLRATARSRLPKADRRKVERLAAAKQEVIRESAELASRLAKLCGLSVEEWNASRRQIQTRVERISADANRRQAERARSATSRPQSPANDTDDTADSWAVWIRRLLVEDATPPPIVVAEELSSHVMVADVPASVVEEIEIHAAQYPGTTTVEQTRRTYPGGPLAAHVLGHLGPVDGDGPDFPSVKMRLSPSEETAPYLPDELAGRMGIERQYEVILRGRPGMTVERSNRSGRAVVTYCTQEPRPGRDVALTLDLALQRTAEELLQGASERRTAKSASESAGGAIAVMDVRNGEMLAAASTPAFDPNLFARNEGELASVLADKAHPLFDRVCRMAIAPGSAFKVLAAIALAESKTIRPQEVFFCQGYLHKPDSQRCEIFVRQGVGHGNVTLADALCVSCNVYFFHYAGQMGAGPLVDWSARFGFGRPTGIDLPGEASGTVPSPETLPRIEGRAWRTADTQSLAIGQGSLTVTPLQMLRMIAAIANGGRLVTPHVKQRCQNYFLATNSSDTFLRRETLAVIREGLERVVADPHGTAHATAYLESTAIGGKTGTAQTSDDRQSHAWFVGYAPAGDPKIAFVVAIEHAGDAGTTAAPVAKRLVVRMEQLGLL